MIKLRTELNLERDMGILVSNNLSWQDQVHSAVSKACRIWGLIKIAFKNIDCKAFKQVYSWMIRSYQEYGVYVWKTYLFKRINKAESVQIRVTKMVYKIFTMDYDDRLRFFKLNFLQNRKISASLIQVFLGILKRYNLFAVLFTHLIVKDRGAIVFNLKGTWLKNLLQDIIFC